MSDWVISVLVFLSGTICGYNIASIRRDMKLKALIAESDRFAAEWMQLDRDVRRGLAARKKTDA